MAVRAVKSAPADGRSLLLCASITEIQSAKANPLYDVTQDLAPVILGFEAPYVLIAGLDVPVNSFGELVELRQAEIRASCLMPRLVRGRPRISRSNC